MLLTFGKNWGIHFFFWLARLAVRDLQKCENEVHSKIHRGVVSSAIIVELVCTPQAHTEEHFLSRGQPPGTLQGDTVVQSTKSKIGDFSAL